MRISAGFIGAACLLAVCAAQGADGALAVRKGDRPEISWSIMHPVAIDVGYMKRVVAKAEEYGNVDSFELCGLEQIGINALSLFERYPHASAKVDRAFVEKTRADLNAVCELAHGSGKPVYFWHRENLVPKGIFEDVPELLDADGYGTLVLSVDCPARP